MERLGQRDLESTLSYVRDLYAVDDPASFKRHVLGTISDLVPSDLTTYNELDLRTSENVWKWEPVPSDFAELTQVFAIHMEENPCIAYFRRTGDGRATKISDFLAQRELHNLGYYSEYLQRAGLEYRMSMTTPKPPHSVIALALGRSTKDFPNETGSCSTCSVPTWFRPTTAPLPWPGCGRNLPPRYQRSTRASQVNRSGSSG